LKAVVCRSGDLEVSDVPNPQPASGQALLNVSRAGICGSDLHLREVSRRSSAAAKGAPNSRQKQGIVFGHEFCGEVADYGPETTRRWKPGSLVVAMPVCRHGREPHMIGSEAAPGAFAEQMVVQESMTFPVKNGLPAEHAALTEPMSVAWHAVRRSRIKKRQTAYVIGCGPVGSAVIAMLKVAGVHTVAASDPSPRRRDLAARCGADVVVDPKVNEMFDAAPVRAHTKVAGLLKLPNTPWAVPVPPDAMNLGLDAMEKLRRYPQTPWWYAFRAMHSLNLAPSGPVVFDCAGVPGMLDSLIATAPSMSRLIAVGACMGPDTIRPLKGVMKELDIRFSVGYNPGEFRDSLHMLAEGKVDPEPFITGTVGFAGVDAAFAALEQPEQHAKILIDPSVSATGILGVSA
jgi:threonine dehydrogenase-like Zn-dependent dehydrogenase